MNRRELRFREFANLFDHARIIAQNEEMTVFHTMHTMDKFMEAAVKLSDKYILYYKYELAQEKKTNPNTYHYYIILEEISNDPPFEYPPEFTRFAKK